MDIQHEMRSRGLKVADVARMIRLHPRVASDRLAGRSRWRVEELVTLARAWGVTVDELVGVPSAPKAAPPARLPGEVPLPMGGAV